MGRGCGPSPAMHACLLLLGIPVAHSVGALLHRQEARVVLAKLDAVDAQRAVEVHAVVRDVASLRHHQEHGHDQEKPHGEGAVSHAHPPLQVFERPAGNAAHALLHLLQVVGEHQQFVRHGSERYGDVAVDEQVAAAG